METNDDVTRILTSALIRRMTDDQINRVIGELEYIAEERGDRSGDCVHTQAAQVLVAALESRRERRNGGSVPPPSLNGAPAAAEA